MTTVGILRKMVRAASRRARLLTSLWAAQIKEKAGTPISHRIFCAVCATAESASVIRLPTPGTACVPISTRVISAPCRRASIRNDSSSSFRTCSPRASPFFTMCTSISETSPTRCASSSPSSSTGELISASSLASRLPNASRARCGGGGSSVKSCTVLISASGV